MKELTRSTERTQFCDLGEGCLTFGLTLTNSVPVLYPVLRRTNLPWSANSITGPCKHFAGSRTANLRIEQHMHHDLANGFSYGVSPFVFACRFRFRTSGGGTGFLYNVLCIPPSRYQLSHGSLPVLNLETRCIAASLSHFKVKTRLALEFQN